MANVEFSVYKNGYPRGNHFIELIFSKDKEKENATIKGFDEDTEYDSKKTYEAVGDLLYILYNISICGWGCRGGDHKIEYITGKAYNASVAALKLIKIGFYDEALSLIRSISEIINLFFYFKIDQNSYREWATLSENQRIQAFSPAKIRKGIIALGAEPPIDQEYYSKLCEVGVHVNPQTVPSGYNKSHKALVGGFVLKYAPVAVINDLAHNLMYIIITSAALVMPKEDFEIASIEVQKLGDKLGELSIMNISEVLSKG